MIFLRSLCFFMCLAVFTVLYAFSCFLIYPFMSTSARYTYIRGWSHGALWLLQLFCAVRYEMRGMSNMLAVLDKPIILLSKHQSAWETIAYIALFPKQLCYVFKKELLYIPFFGWTLGMLRMIHIDRQQRDKRHWLSQNKVESDYLKVAGLLFIPKVRGPKRAHKSLTARVGLGWLSIQLQILFQLPTMPAKSGLKIAF